MLPTVFAALLAFNQGTVPAGETFPVNVTWSHIPYSDYGFAVVTCHATFRVQDASGAWATISTQDSDVFFDKEGTWTVNFVAPKLPAGFSSRPAQIWSAATYRDENGNGQAIEHVLNFVVCNP